MDREERIADIVADWRERRERGEHLEVEDLARVYPDLAEDLRDAAEALDLAEAALLMPEPREVPLPERVGPYRILEEIGSGGMGTVYLAEAEEGARVALKIIHPHLLRRTEFLKRFKREAEIGVRIIHENVVRTLTADTAEAGPATHHFLVMEYVEGRTLAELVRDLGEVPEALVREIALQLTTGLQAIHMADVVHRDLKPENAIITGDHRVRIMDLGVARLAAETLRLTREGQFAGSLHYAAPEQFKAVEVGPAADLYALGLVLYELATGKNPFRRDDAAETVQAQLTHVPPRAEDVTSEVSSFLSEVLATLLAKKPSDRFGGADELLAVLRQGEGSAWWSERKRTLNRAARRMPRVPVRRETRLHGREEELALLESAWQSAEGGNGSCLLVEGEAGIGKSRLVDAFLSRIDGREAHVLYGSYAPSGGLGGLSDAILAHFGRTDLPDALSPYLAETPTLVPAFAALLKHEAVPAGTAGITGEALQVVFRHLMRGLTAEKPLIWVAEDLHFADPGSRSILLSLARAVEGSRVLLLLTTRPGVPDDELAWFSPLPAFRRTSLPRLSAREVILLLEDAFRSGALAEKLGGKIAKKSDGVPFFVFEMIRGLEEGRFITELPDGSYIESKVIDEIEVPSAVRDLIEARLGGLTKDERALLDVGAVHGFEFDPDLVARTLGLPRVEVLQALAHVERRLGVVRSAAAAYRFDHHQIQEVVYEDLPEALRREYHALLAGAIADREGVAEREPADLPGEIAFDLARHHLEGHEPLAALPFLAPALDHLDSAYRNDALLAVADRALHEKGVLSGELRARVLLKMAKCLDRLGRREKEIACLEEAMALAEGIADPKLRLRAHQLRGRCYSSLGRHDEALLEQLAAKDLALEIGDREGEAKTRVNLIGAYVFLGRVEEAQQEAARAIDLARRLGDLHVESGALINLGMLLLDLGKIDRAQASLEQGAEIARRCGNRTWEANALGNLGWLHLGQGRVEQARESFERALSIFREIGHRQSGAQVMAMLGDVLSLLGRHEEARDRYGSVLVALRETGDRRGAALALKGVADQQQCLGRLAEAMENCERAFEILKELDDPESEMWSELRLGCILSTLGRHEEARAHLDRSLEISRDQGSQRDEARVLEAQGCLAERCGGDEEAGRLYGKALAIRRELDIESERLPSLSVLGAFLAERERVDEARPLLEEALALGRKLDSPRAIVPAACGMALLPGGDPREAIAALDRHRYRLAHEDRMGAVNLLWKATGDSAHLEEAHRLLCELRDHAPPEYRETMIANVPLHRDIMAAWGTRRR